MRGWLLLETLVVLTLANALIWFVVAIGWPRLTFGLRWVGFSGFPAQAP